MNHDFKVGQRVTWRNFLEAHPVDQVGHYWDGLALCPQGYRIIDIDHNLLIVETKRGGTYAEHFKSFARVGPKFQRNLPEWW